MHNAASPISEAGRGRIGISRRTEIHGIDSSCSFDVRQNIDCPSDRRDARAACVRCWVICPLAFQLPPLTLNQMRLLSRSTANPTVLPEAKISDVTPIVFSGGVLAIDRTLPSALDCVTIRLPPDNVTPAALSDGLSNGGRVRIGLELGDRVGNSRRKRSPHRKFARIATARRDGDCPHRSAPGTKHW
ncbi:hypothetical protein ABIB73_000799 [Bradyrhizobium sp. F1.4.3]